MTVRRISCLLALLAGLAGCATPGPAPGGWGWKLATDAEDVMRFLNGTGAYTTPVSDARISAIWKDGHAEFVVFYQRRAAAPADGWGWKLATTPGDALAFLNGTGAYARPVRDAQIAALRTASHTAFYVFYRSLPAGESPAAGWGWKRAPDAQDAMAFLNGTGAYSHPVTTARIVAYDVDGRDEFVIFYQRATHGVAIANWRWKLATTVEDAFDYVNGSGAYAAPVAGFEASGMWKGTHARHHVFANQGTRIWIQGPLENERFVQGEPITLRALVTSDTPLDGNAVSWRSSVDGELGSGGSLIASGLAPGAHALEAAGYGTSATVAARVHGDLGELYAAEPSPAEVARIQSEFTLSFVDGTGSDEAWSAYGAAFDQSSTDPTRLAIAAKLDVARHQAFAEPLPFTAGASLMDHLKATVNTFTVRLDCAPNTGGGGGISVNRNMSVWDARASGSAADPDACKTPFASPGLNPYVSPVYLVVHEARHSEPGDPGHVSCDGASNRDPGLEVGSGHAWAALYTMWVYKYGLYDPPAVKTHARDVARTLLSSRFCSPPTHSNPLVQAIVDELLAP